MNCSFCDNDKTAVSETRRGEDGVYRRRKCLACNESFVSRETAPPGLKMPTEFWQDRAVTRLNGRKVEQPKQQTKAKSVENSDGIIRSDGKHLQGIW